MQNNCVSCGEIIPEGNQVCPSCQSESEWGKRVKYLMANQRCVRCCKQDAYTLAGKQRCFDCTEKEKKNQRKYNEAHREEIKLKMKERSAKLKAEGICVFCGKRKARTKRTLCAHCAAKQKLRYYQKTKL